MATPANTFSKVERPDADAVTVSLGGEAAAPSGTVLGPGERGTGVALGQDGSLTAHQAISVACQLANELDRTVVVVDPLDRWRSEWGRLVAA